MHMLQQANASTHIDTYTAASQAMRQHTHTSWNLSPTVAGTPHQLLTGRCPFLTREAQQEWLRLQCLQLMCSTLGEALLCTGDLPCADDRGIILVICCCSLLLFLEKQQAAVAEAGDNDLFPHTQCLDLAGKLINHDTGLKGFKDRRHLKCVCCGVVVVALQASQPTQGGQVGV